MKSKSSSREAARVLNTFKNLGQDMEKNSICFSGLTTIT